MNSDQGEIDLLATSNWEHDAAEIHLENQCDIDDNIEIPLPDVEGDEEIDLSRDVDQGEQMDLPEDVICDGEIPLQQLHAAEGKGDSSWRIGDNCGPYVSRQVPLVRQSKVLITNMVTNLERYVTKPQMKQLL